MLLKQTIRPEFLNRIDETIMFMPLNKAEIASVVRLQTDAVAGMLQEQGVRLEVTQKAVDFLAEAGFDPEFGARPIKRAVQHLLLNELSKRILAEQVNRARPIVVDASATGLTFEN